MKPFIAYLRQRRKGGLLLLCFVVVFTVIFALYRIPVGAVLYPALLCLLIGTVFLGMDFLRFRGRHRALQKLTDISEATLAELPRAETLEEEDYQEIVRSLSHRMAAAAREMEARYRDMVDYYTVWAHQIKTPIAAMQLSLQNEDTQLARKLVRELCRTEQYVEMVTTFLRLDSKSTDYVFRKQKLDPIIRRAVKRFAAEFIDRKLRLDYEPTELEIITDEKWLGFVLEQILSNALKYTPRGGIRIGVSEDRELFIEDTGIGIEPADLPRIFEKGYTGYNGRENQKASGIGLYLCRRVCDNLEIPIRAESPVQADSGGRADLRAQAESPAQSGGAPGRGTRITLGLNQYHLTKA